MTFGERLKDLRTEKKLTQKQVAEALKVGRATISGYETKSMYPDYDKLVALADFFQCSTDYLLGRTETPKFLSTSEIILTDSILNILKCENLISNDTLTQYDISSVCEQLRISVTAIKLLQELNKSNK